MIGMLLLAVLSTGCGRSDDAPTPPDVRYGQDTCARCAMIIEDARCVGALVPADGDPLVFDDISEMLQWRREHPDRALRAMWVHDFERADWIDARNASYVVGSRFTTPMGGGILAAASTERGLALAARRGGRVTDLDDASASLSPNPSKERNTP